MFEELNHPDVRLMLDLSRENLANPEDLQSRLEGTEPGTFFAICREHELDGVVASHILEAQLMELPSEWRAAYEAEKKHLSILRDKATDICRIMAEHGIRMVVLKNGGIMCDMVADAAACPMEDIDSLVRKKDFLAAHELLLQCGLTFQFRSAFEKEELEAAYRDGSTEYYVETPSGNKMWFELAWRAVAGRWIRQDLEPDADGLVERAYCAEGTEVGILSPEDNLLQVCVHTAKHSYVRAPGLRLHLDVERIVAHKPIDWDLFLQRVKAAHVKTSTYFSLYFAKRLFDTPIPDEVLKALEPPRRKKEKVLSLLGKAGLLHPKQKKFSKLQFLRFQTSLYDSVADMWYVLYPKNGRLHEIYGYKCPLKTPFYILVRALDLVGIRIRKK